MTKTATHLTAAMRVVRDHLHERHVSAAVAREEVLNAAQRVEEGTAGPESARLVERLEKATRCSIDELAKQAADCRVELLMQHVGLSLQRLLTRPWNVAKDLHELHNCPLIADAGCDGGAAIVMLPRQVGTILADPPRSATDGTSGTGSQIHCARGTAGETLSSAADEVQGLRPVSIIVSLASPTPFCGLPSLTRPLASWVVLPTAWPATEQRRPTRIGAQGEHKAAGDRRTYA